MERLVLSLLGGFDARWESGPGVVVPTQKARALLAYLACSRSERHSRDKLAALLWGDSEQGCARHSLRQGLYVLRSTLDSVMPRILRCDSDSVALDRSRLSVDSLEFERLAHVDAQEALERAGDLYRGDFLVGIAAGNQTFEDWLRDERDRLNELAFDVYGKLLAHQWKAGLLTKAILSAQRLLAIDPLQEDAYQVLMRLYIAQGHLGAARRQYQACVRMLHREFGVGPQSETKALLTEITSRRVVRKLRDHVMDEVSDPLTTFEGPAA